MTDADEVAHEQRALDVAFTRRDALATAFRDELAGMAAVADDPVTAREIGVRRSHLGARLAQLGRADDGLIFGRLDSLDGRVLRIGRIGLSGADDEADPVVLDWRAPAARPFYTATPLDPQGQARRRHIRTRGRVVAGVSDDPLDPASGTDGLVGEGALLDALARRRTGRMGAAVATLQREQDAIVRADHRGALVVQGGPGTGKTVVALHRVAYLLFTHPHLAERGVLVVGPSTRFLDYIEQVLPALGETQVVTRTPDTLVPGAAVTVVEPRATAELMGRGLWQWALTAFVEALAPRPADLTLRLDGEKHVIDGARVADAIGAARADGRPYHAAGRIFRARILDLLAGAVAARSADLLADVERGYEADLARLDASLAERPDERGVKRGGTGAEVDGVLTEEDVAALRERLATAPTVLAELDRLWPAQAPAELLRRLLGDEDLLARFAPQLSAAERATVIGRRAGDGSTSGSCAGASSSDIALLDALADLLGDIAERPPPAAGAFLAERAAAARDWVYGHIVVDEAQELSAMQWHMLRRRCPTRSLTIVGDIDQATSPHGARTWAQALAPAFGDRVGAAELTICYRTPSEVMALTAAVLVAAGSANAPPVSVRSTGVAPWTRTAGRNGVVAVAASCVDDLRERYAGGLVAVIAAPEWIPALRRALQGRAGVITAHESKGMEFDATVLVDPDAISEAPRGWNALYVAMTRCTQELGIIRPAAR